MNHDMRIAKARSSLIQGHPFWGQLILYLKPVATDRFETFATDGKSLFYNPAYLETLKDVEVEGVCVHEVMHIVSNHHIRRGKRDAKVWNEAADHAINPLILAGGFRLPEGALVDLRFQGMGAEEIFAVLWRERRQAQSAQNGLGKGVSGSAGSSSGAGKPPSQPPQNASPQGPQEGPRRREAEKGNPDPSQGGNPSLDPSKRAYGEGGNPPSCGEVLDAMPEGEGGKNAYEEAEWAVRVREAIAVAKGCGNIPAHLQVIFDELKKPRIDPWEILHRFINDKVKTTSSWNRPDRRYMNAGFIVPGNVPDGINALGIIWDTSGSTFDPVIQSKFKSHIQDALSDGSTRQVIMISCDTEVKNLVVFEEGDDVTRYVPKGGGGTRFGPAIAWFEKHYPEVSALIYFTDLDATDFGEEPRVPTLWAAVGQANIIRDRAAKVPFGEVIHLVD